jgi:nucleoside phosphorylase
VIDKCLDPTTWRDANDERLDSEALRTILYQEVVRPLENDLRQAFSFISITNLDQFAQTLDMSRWDQTIRNQQTQQLIVPPFGRVAGRNVFAGTNVSGDSLTLTIHEPIHEPNRPPQRRPSRREDFQIAIICALALEYDAVSLLFDQFCDEERDFYGRAQGDTNTYTTGRMGKHDAVLALLPNMGIATAAGAAACVRSSFSGLKLAFLVGVCGGVPGAGANEVLLGDVVISKTPQHGLGKQYPTAFMAKDTVNDVLGRPNKDIRSLIASFETEMGRQRLQKQAGAHLKQLQEAAAHQCRQCDYRYPGVAEDRLFVASYHHRHQAPEECGICSGSSQGFCEKATLATCAELHCDDNQLLPRKRLKTKQNLALDEMQCPEIFVGRMASGDTVMKSGEHRDHIAAKHGVIAFEMEGAGAWDEVPCIVIKGVCDYADSHKNKVWQPFAAATAASVMKAVLGRYARSDKPRVD